MSKPCTSRSRRSRTSPGEMPSRAYTRCPDGCQFFTVAWRGSLDVSCHAAAYMVAGPGVADGTARIADRIDALPVVPRQDVGSGVGAERGGPQAAGLVGAGAGGDPAGAARRHRHPGDRPLPSVLL